MIKRRVQTIDHTYARALLETATAHGEVESVEADFKTVTDALEAHQELGIFLASPRIPTERKTESIKRMFGEAIGTIMLHFLLVLNQRNRLDRLRSLHDAWRILRDHRDGRVHGAVTTAQEMAEGDLDRIKQVLGRWMGRELSLEQKVEPALIGGIKLRLEDDLLDGSVQAQLRLARRNLLDRGRSEARAMARQIQEQEPISFKNN
ncbi:MAG: ATP synthase F1 subunit delta [Phycisphaeraceae bacterium]|nr:ATP synthase F1 subunit delta [Phycisphaeraceae bacterium]